MKRPVLSAALLLAPAIALADAELPPDPRALLAPGSGCSSPWLPSAAPPPSTGEAPPMMRLALHRCVLDFSLPPKPRLRLT